MTDNYSQSIDVEVSQKARQLQWAGIGMILASMGFVLISAFYSWYFMFGFALLFVGGGVCVHFYNKTSKEYTYDFSTSKLRIVKKDVVNRQSVYVDLMWNDVESFEIMNDVYDEKSDLMCASKAYEQGVWQIVFWLSNEKKRLLFAPDDYLVALIKENLKGSMCAERKTTDKTPMPEIEQK